LRKVEEELEWFFGYAESALRRGRVAMLPSHAAARSSSRNARPKAQQLARTVEDRLLALAAPHTAVLRAVFTPRRWPRAVQEAFEHLSPIAVRLFVGSIPWPWRSARQGLEEAVALQLAACLRHQDQSFVEPLRLQACHLFEGAMDAYAHKRSEVTPDSR
jgi:hypothetical protein